MTISATMRILAGVFLATVLAACGGGGGGGGVTVAPPVTVTPPVTAPTLKYPIPASLWKAPAGAVPATGNYVYLQSSSGDYIGGGRTYGYTNADSALGVSASGLALNLNVKGNEAWTGRFLLPSAAGNLQAGYFDNLTRTPFADPAVGGIDWSGEGRGCNTIQGWVAIDNIVMSGSTVTALDLRFEQRCEGGGSALHGQVHWSASDTTTPPGPQNPPPAGLWTPPAAILPLAGNYVVLASDVDDYIGGGRTELFTAANMPITVDTRLTAAVQISVGPWSGSFYGMNTLSQLQPGYYGGLQRYPFNNAIKGGMDWSGNGRGCNKLTGWFVVDKVSYALGELTAIDLRFEQHCEGLAPALHGAIHWTK